MGYYSIASIDDVMDILHVSPKLRLLRVWRYFLNAAILKSRPEGALRSLDAPLDLEFELTCTDFPDYPDYPDCYPEFAFLEKGLQERATFLGFRWNVIVKHMDAECGIRLKMKQSWDPVRRTCMCKNIRYGGHRQHNGRYKLDCFRKPFNYGNMCTFASI